VCVCVYDEHVCFCVYNPDYPSSTFPTHNNHYLMPTCRNHTLPTTFFHCPPHTTLITLHPTNYRLLTTHGTALGTNHHPPTTHYTLPMIYLPLPTTHHPLLIIDSSEPTHLPPKQRHREHPAPVRPLCSGSTQRTHSEQRALLHIRTVGDAVCVVVVV
jgi:hypothetical protein